MTISPFHLAIPVDDLSEAEAFYGGILKCATGRRSSDWIDFDFYGHQLVAHLSPEECRRAARNNVDGQDVPVRHFGVVLGREAWEAAAARLKEANIAFIIEPTVRHDGQPGEQRTFFLLDPAGNALEFKSFTRPDELFAV